MLWYYFKFRIIKGILSRSFCSHFLSLFSPLCSPITRSRVTHPLRKYRRRIFGMGMPTLGVYVLLAVLEAPSLVDVGFQPLAAAWPSTIEIGCGSLNVALASIDLWASPRRLRSSSALRKSKSLESESIHDYWCWPRHLPLSIFDWVLELYTFVYLLN